MKNLITINRIKILLVVTFVYFSVKIMAPNIFLADSPKINPAFIAGILAIPSNIAAIPGNMMASLNKFKFKYTNTQQNITVDEQEIANVSQITPPPNVQYKQVSKGVFVGTSKVSAEENIQTGVQSGTQTGSNTGSSATTQTEQKFIKITAGTKYKIIGYMTINGKTYPKIEFVE